ncbi:MAG TPA: ribonuclease HII [Geobacterales bacterium]|nr:ribonuclease HII [Geobacterales bacterium]
MMITLGIDEAGRGPLIGPMVIAGCSFEEKDLLKLKELGVKDSKQLSVRSREKLYHAILNLAKGYRIYIVSPKEIDDAVSSKLKITGLEAQYMAKIISEIYADEIYIDSPMRDAARFLNMLKKYLGKEYNIICEIKADETYIQVSAASILAKVTRDKEIKFLQEKYGDFGSGYPSDPRTVEFIKHCIEKNELPMEVRRTWKSLKRISETRLTDF